MQNKKLSKKLPFVLVVFLYIVFLITRFQTGNSSLIDLYFGPTYYDPALSTANTLLFYSILIFYSFSVTEDYIKSYGIYIVTRTKKRNSLLSILLRKLTIRVLEFTLCGQFFFGLINLIINNSILNFDNYLESTILFILVCINLSLLQLLMEILFDSKLSLMITLSYFLISIYASKIIYINKYNSFFNIVFYPNFSLVSRRPYIELLFFTKFTFLILFTVIHIFLIYKAFKKKDLL